ncbi:HK97 gp10 family phage protein [Senegalia sp. (in: firmicutes)]|uniref:HK97 gp10 family phage protein n=1 Tax=Senegalia sp. (in: firmicutes) TaxID=1924098 RepID=UPI003F98B96D
MAKASFKMPEDFLKKVSGLNNKLDDIVPRVLEKGAEPAVEKAKNNLSLRIGQGTKEPSESTGELLKAIESTKPEQDNKGNWMLRVGAPKSKDSKGVSNALKAAVIEYGKSGQPPKPWLKTTKSQSRKPCIEAMKTALDKEIEKI